MIAGPALQFGDRPDVVVGYVLDIGPPDHAAFGCNTRLKSELWSRFPLDFALKVF